MKPNDLPGNGATLLTRDQLRKALSCFGTGVAVVTTLDHNGAPVGLTVDSFNSVSMDPPLVLWSLALSAPSLPAFRSHPAFVVNILSHAQLDDCRRFALTGTDKFNGVQWLPGLHGAPVLNGNLATLHCLNYRQYAGGDHEIFLGEVARAETTDQAPLIYYRGQFGTMD